MIGTDKIGKHLSNTMLKKWHHTTSVFPRWYCRPLGNTPINNSATHNHDHIIRDARELDRIANYVEHNIANWKSDKFMVCSGTRNNPWKNRGPRHGWFWKATAWWAIAIGRPCTGSPGCSSPAWPTIRPSAPGVPTPPLFASQDANPLQVWVRSCSFSFRSKPVIRACPPHWPAPDKTPTYKKVEPFIFSILNVGLGLPVCMTLENKPHLIDKYSTGKLYSRCPYILWIVQVHVGGQAKTRFLFQ